MSMLRIRDALGRDHTFARAPERVVSLVPSDTYTLFRLGVGAKVVGCTRYCEGPWLATLPQVGGTKDVDVNAVLALAPDLVIANAEENPRHVLEALAVHTKVWVSVPRRVDEGVAHVAQLARILRVARTPDVAALLRAGMNLPRLAPSGVRAFIPIWHDPLMTCNGDTYGADVLARLGIANVFEDRLRLYPLAADLGKAAALAAEGRDQRYPRVTIAELQTRRPSHVLVPDEPHAFSPAELAALAAHVPTAIVHQVSGKDLFWYGAWTIDHLAGLAAKLAALRPA